MTTYEIIEQLLQELEEYEEVNNELKRFDEERLDEDEEERKILEGVLGDMEEERDELEKEKEELKKDVNDSWEQVKKFRDALLVDFGEGKADTRRFKDYQDEKDSFILNYRPSYAAGLPVTLCSDILAKFQDDVKGNIELNKDDIIFVRVFDIYDFGNNRATDCSIMFTKGIFQVSLLSLAPAISQSRFPVFLVYLAGSYMGVAGVVFLENPVCEPLTPVMLLFYLLHHEDILLKTAYVVKALKIALTNLEKFYDQLSQHNQIITENRYVFQAIMEYNGGLSSQHVIIKFAKRYSEACHKKCQALGIAPKLFFCEQIAGGWYIVIMEQLMEHDLLFYFDQDKIRLMSILNKVIDPDDSIKIIDFDWSGKVEEVVYPPLLNQEIDVWHPDIKAGEKILPEHDLYILDTELKKCEL
ncbi:15268_t:CDS:2 [Funneliformis mosseae]|uniref:15268_t:CDS:1 n=1 Tax=Funneliformis mosseae TaxID=27381 RepID=A0A9N9C4E8_FUNMO|nr:15268_t:CDS:2 [Funneliformis mosseae]